MLTFLAIVAVVALGFLAWKLFQGAGAGRIGALTDKRRATSRIVSRAEFADGNRRMEVALALTQTTLFYENRGMQGALDLQWVREVEYDDALATGAEVSGREVLRLRTDSQAFEFILPKDEAARWHLMLPPRRIKDRPLPPIVTTLAAQGANTP